MPLTIEGVVMTFGRGGNVLDGIDLEVADGESLAITGPSGSGKTTLLSIIGMLIEPVAGRVLLDGTPFPRAEWRRHRIRSEFFGWVLQTVNALPRRTATENVCVPLLAAGWGRGEAERAAAAALERVGLGSRADVDLRHLSGGEVQRVCIARALAHRPRFLLADEPTGQLDRRTSLEVLEAMWQLVAETGSTLIVATHDPSVSSACARVVELVDGKARER